RRQLLPIFTSLARRMALPRRKICHRQWSKDQYVGSVRLSSNRLAYLTARLILSSKAVATHIHVFSETHGVAKKKNLPQAMVL
ncbi:MAG: hypothetical protein AAF399_01675, partial [Bacteroidota bacterium]